MAIEKKGIGRTGKQAGWREAPCVLFEEMQTSQPASRWRTCTSSARKKGTLHGRPISTTGQIPASPGAPGVGGQWTCGRHFWRGSASESGRLMCKDVQEMDPVPCPCPCRGGRHGQSHSRRRAGRVARGRAPQTGDSPAASQWAPATAARSRPGLQGFRACEW
jgi:hypothetical protein